MAKPRIPFEERFWSHVDKGTSPDACWNYTSFPRLNLPNPYNTVMVHRVAWMMTNGDIPKRSWVKWKCKNKSCVNPAHMELATKEAKTDKATRKTFDERFWAKVDKGTNVDACWNWTGYKRNGYGTSEQYNSYKTAKVHRISWIMANGEIPAGHRVKWKCKNKLCVNPAHLYLMANNAPRGTMENRPRKPRGSLSQPQPNSPATNAIMDCGYTSEVERVLNTKVAGECTDEQKIIMYPFLRNMVNMVMYSQMRGINLLNQLQREELVERVLDTTLNRLLKGYDCKKWNGKKVNYFSFVIRQHLIAYYKSIMLDKIKYLDLDEEIFVNLPEPEAEEPEYNLGNMEDYKTMFYEMYEWYKKESKNCGENGTNYRNFKILQVVKGLLEGKIEYELSVFGNETPTATIIKNSGIKGNSLQNKFNGMVFKYLKARGMTRKHLTYSPEHLSRVLRNIFAPV